MATKTAVRAKTRCLREGPREPVWVSRAMLDAIHDAQLREHGGSSGVRGEGLLDSALNRPRNKSDYGERGLGVLAAAYAFGLVKNHGFVDGNKRSAFTTAALFLALNGVELEAPEPEVVDVMNRLASRKLTEARFAEWIRSRVAPQL
jgi:death on curing protein